MALVVAIILGGALVVWLGAVIYDIVVIDRRRVRQLDAEIQAFLAEQERRR